MVKRHLTQFETVEEYEAFVQSEAFERPNVSKIKETGRLAYAKSSPGPVPPVHDYSQDYLTFRITDSGNIGWFNDGGYNPVVIEYSKNEGSWTPITATSEGSLISVETGDVVRFKGNNETYDGANLFNNWDGELTTAQFEVEGNIMSLIYGDNFIGQIELPPATWTFCCLFACCTGLTSAENLVLPATTLADGCYDSMFYNCTSLTAAPELPAITLAESCYDYMFQDCTSLTTAPELPATTLANGCYASMFYGCTSLNYIKCLATDISANYCTSDWVNGVAANGTFVKNPNMPDWTTGDSGIPNGWTVEDENGNSITINEPDIPGDDNLSLIN